MSQLLTRRSERPQRCRKITVAIVFAVVVGSAASIAFGSIHALRAVQRLNTYEKAPTCGAFAEPSDGLEPSTPSLPWRIRSASASRRRAASGFVFSCSYAVLPARRIPVEPP